MRKIVDVKPLGMSEEDEGCRCGEKKSWTRPRLRTHRVETATRAGYVVFPSADISMYS